MRWMTVAALLAVVACHDAVAPTANAPDRQAHFPAGPAAPAVGLDQADTLAEIYDWGGNKTVRIGKVLMARGVPMSWQVGDAIPLKANGQEYYEWYTEPKLGTITASQPARTVNQETNCYNDMQSKIATPRAVVHRSTQSLVWRINDRQPRRELVTGEMLVFARGITSGVLTGTMRRCVKVDSVYLIRTAWEYTYLQPGRPTVRFAALSNWITHNIGEGYSTYPWAWCYGTSAPGADCNVVPAISVRTVMGWNRYCNYFGSGGPQYTMQIWAGADHYYTNWRTKPKWETYVVAPPQPFGLPQTYSGTFGGIGELSYEKYGAPMELLGMPPGEQDLRALETYYNICAFSANNNDQRAGYAIWRLDNDYQYSNAR